MYCSHCGNQIADGANFCAKCGAAVQGAPAAEPSHSKLERPWANRKIAGVCAAFAQAYGWDLTLVRLIAVLLAFFGCGGVLGYVIAWACIPDEPKHVAASSAASTT
jgi:phage shock protein C